MLRMYRNQNQEVAIKKRNSPNDVDDYIRVKVLDIDLHTGRVEIGVQATQSWNIYRAESPRDDNHDNDK